MAGRPKTYWYVCDQEGCRSKRSSTKGDLNISGIPFCKTHAIPMREVTKAEHEEHGKNKKVEFTLRQQHLVTYALQMLISNLDDEAEDDMGDKKGALSLENELELIKEKFEK